MTASVPDICILFTFSCSNGCHATDSLLLIVLRWWLCYITNFHETGNMGFVSYIAEVVVIVFKSSTCYSMFFRDFLFLFTLYKIMKYRKILIK